MQKHRHGKVERIDKKIRGLIQETHLLNNRNSKKKKRENGVEEMIKEIFEEIFQNWRTD